MTLQLLWEEHRAAHPDGYGYSRFCELYRAWEGRLSPTMRQTHVAGERLFVDYAGTTLEVIDGTTGEVMTAQLFVAALGASNYTYAEATWTQRLADWIGSHTRAFAFFGGVPAMVVSDNLKSGITKACFYEPAVNRSLRRDGGPLRHRHRAGAAVQAARQGQGRSRRCRWRRAGSSPSCAIGSFFSLAELNAAIARTGRAAQRPRDAASGREPARAVRGDRSARRSSRCRPSPTSTPSGRNAGSGSTTTSRSRSTTTRCRTTLLREKVWARITARTVEVFHRGKRVAAHVRSSSNRKHTTVREHMPSSHRRYADWTPERLRRQAGEIGRKHLGAGRDHPARAHAPRARLPRLRSASCGSPRATAASGSRPPAPGRSRSARAPTPRSTRS